MDAKYYESHVTIEPVFGNRLELFQVLCQDNGFKAAKLLMQKDRETTPERSNKDTFCTGHSKYYEDLRTRMNRLRFELERDGFKVWRCKIEAVLLDERFDRAVS